MCRLYVFYSSRFCTKTLAIDSSFRVLVSMTGMRYCGRRQQFLGSLLAILMIHFLTTSHSEKQLREWTATYSVDERGSVLDGLFAFVSGIFAKGEEKKTSSSSSSSSSSSGPDVAQVICNQCSCRITVYY